MGTGNSIRVSHRLVLHSSCHQEIAKTFQHTGMGSSFHFATHQKSAADFSKNHVIYDTLNDLFYAQIITFDFEPPDILTIL